ncbi:hypothetical protein B5V02_02015 [Mesorhizobium kowhaii]|uniref:Uncharacterized protein n=1 Tax=Mesorhizobium kowhaii TaxID=1300272 RepID=A0A2W7CA77_9HYPH|nr:hypothetical protein B5V02_02015 [Mesorhizobium kowhaii]
MFHRLIIVQKNLVVNKTAARFSNPGACELYNAADPEIQAPTEAWLKRYNDTLGQTAEHWQTLLAEWLMALEVGAATGAASGEKNPLRTAQRNGYRERGLCRPPVCIPSNSLHRW